MAEKILMIALSPTMNDGTITDWNKKEGEQVAAGDVLCVVETDKAAMDYESQSEGVLRKILVPAGGQANVGDTIAILGSADEDITALLEPSPAEASEASPRPEAPSKAAAASPARVESVAQPAASAPSAGRVRSSPLARKVALARGIDIATIEGSGPGGRVVKRDVEAWAPAAPDVGGAQGRASAVRSAQSVPLTAKRKVIAQRLAESAFSAPHFYLTVRIEMDGLMAARERLNRGRDAKVGFNAFLHKLAAEALRRHPEVNSSWRGDSIQEFGSVDIGLAVALPDGLITPVVRDCDLKGVLAIDAELGGLIKKAREGKLAPDEFTGATFTISNLGSFGIDEFTAIINPPASAILAVGQVRKVPIVSDGDQVVVRSMMKATLSCDHRVIDGATGAAFLKDLKEMIENPYAVLL